MRLITFNTSEENVDSIARAAFTAGVESVSVRRSERRSSNGSVQVRFDVEISASTPTANLLVHDVMASEYFDSNNISIAIRQPRSLISRESIRSITIPLAEPGTDLLEELWQFSHITYGLIGRVLIAGGLLGYGLIQHSILLMIAGLLFLPLLPMLQAIGFGVVTKQSRLAIHGLLAFVLAVGLIFSSSLLVAVVAGGPVKYNEFPPFLVSLVISGVVGAAAGLASIDDVGRRELIGLAAAAQIGILPAWIGVTTALGLPPNNGTMEISTRVGSLFANSVVITITAAAVLVLSGVTKNIRFIKNP